MVFPRSLSGVERRDAARRPFRPRWQRSHRGHPFAMRIQQKANAIVLAATTEQVNRMHFRGSMHFFLHYSSTVSPIRILSGRKTMNQKRTAGTRIAGLFCAALVCVLALPCALNRGAPPLLCGVRQTVRAAAGASVLWTRPLLRTNGGGKNIAPLRLFFFFRLRTRGGGRPRWGPPPLFMGYLNGVPFTWTL